MNTKQITQGAMVCAIYGLLLFLNQQTALFIESGFSWIFVFPILIYTAKSNGYAGFICTIAMALETVFFGGFTTWFYSWTSLLIGYVYGLSIQKQWPNGMKLAITFFFTVISYALIFTFWAALFQIDYTTDFEWIHQILPFMNIEAFMGIAVLFLSLLQTLCIHLIAILICVRMKIAMRPIKTVVQIQAPKWVGIVSIFIFIVFFSSLNMLEYSKGVQNIILVIFFVDLFILDYYGTIYLLNRIRKNKKCQRQSFWICLGAFTPIVQVVWILLGELDCLFNLRNKEIR